MSSTAATRKGHQPDSAVDGLDVTQVPELTPRWQLFTGQGTIAARTWR